MRNRDGVLCPLPAWRVCFISGFHIMSTMYKAKIENVSGDSPLLQEMLVNQGKDMEKFLNSLRFMVLSYSRSYKLVF